MRASSPETTIAIEDVDLTERPDMALKYRVMATPAIAIDGELAFVGIPSEETLAHRLAARPDRD